MRGESKQTPQPRAGYLPVVTLELAEAGGDSPQQAPTLLASSLLSYRVCRWSPRLCTLEPGQLITALAEPTLQTLPCLEGEPEASRLLCFHFSTSKYPPIT